MRASREARFASSSASRLRLRAPGPERSADSSASSAARVADRARLPLAGGVGGARQLGPGSVGELAAAHGPGQRLDPGPQPAALLGDQEARHPQVAAAEPRRRPPFGVRVGALEPGLDRIGPEPGEAHRAAARAHRLEQRLGLGADQDQVGEGGRLLERLQQRVLAFLGHRVRVLDHEHPPLALERAVGDLSDHPLAHGLDQVLGPRRAQPGEVRVRRGVGERPPPGVGRVGGPVGEQLGGQSPRRRPLPGAARPGEQVGVKRLRGGGGQGLARDRLVGGRLGDRGAHRRSSTAARRRAATSPTSPAPSTTTIRSG